MPKSTKMAKPEIFARDLDDLDLARLVRGVQMVRTIFAADPLNTFVVAEATPGPAVSSNDAVADWVRESHFSNSHWCCSAPMGRDRGTSVVDDDLKVHGTTNLHVVDASVMPSIPNGNVHSTVVAVASVFAKRLAASLLP